MEKNDLTVMVHKQKSSTPLERETPALQPGCFVAWDSGGQKREGIIDFLHTDPDGKQWVFVSWGKTWAAVDRKLVKVVTP